MFAYPKIGVHTAVGGNPTGVGNYVQQLDAAGRVELGRKALIMCADGTTGLSDAYALIDQGSPVPHVLAWRKVSGPLSENDPEFYGVPDYALEPLAAAIKHWQQIIKPTIPPQVTAHKAHTWIVPINEPDKNRANWLGLFGVEMAKLMNADGYKVAMFGWSAGEPEPEHWELPGMLAYLTYCQAHPDEAAVSVHEYSFSQGTIWTGKDAQGNIVPINPDTDELVLVGRFKKIFAVCAAHNIARPKVLITEWGWEQNDVPEPAVAMQHIDDAMARLYAHYPEVEVPGLWYLGPGYGGVANQAQKLIAPITQHAITQQYQVIEPPPTQQEPRTLKHTIHLLPQDTTPEELEAVTTYLQPSKTAFAYSHDVIEAVMYHSLPTGNIFMWDAERWNFDPQQQFGWLGVNLNLKRFSDLGLPPGDPFAGLEMGAPFDEPFAITGLVGDPRSYGPHEGVDADIFTSQQNSTEPVRCIYPGTVITPPRPVAGYGPHLVVVRGVYNGQEMIFWYGHMDQHFVQVGETVTRGQPIGELGAQGNASGEHIHITWQTPGQGLGGFFLPDIRDPLPYMSLVPEPVGVDMGAYFSPAQGEFGPVYKLSNNWGQGDEIVQLQKVGDRSYVVKNQQYEQRHITPGYIDLELDTSPGNDEFYRVQGHWLPRFMESGDTFQRTEQVTFYKKATCQQVAQYTSSSLIKLQYVGVRVWGGKSIATVELAWLLNGQIEEIYTYGAGVGLLKWQKPRDGRTSQFSGWLPEHANLQRESEPCL